MLPFCWPAPSDSWMGAMPPAPLRLMMLLLRKSELVLERLLGGCSREGMSSAPDRSEVSP